jgi:glycosyltransferase involved in cell wall biosynthesis
VNAARIGLDARLTRQMSIGMKTYSREVASRLPSVAPQYEYVTFTEGGNSGWKEQLALPLRIARSRLDLVHFLSQYVPLALPRRFIITIHDLIHLNFPQYFKAKVRPYYYTLVRAACARAARVITDDERTVDDLATLLHVDRAKIRTIPLGVDAGFFESASPFAGARPYLLYVGNHRQHKDLPTLFTAWSALPRDWNVDLYVTGTDDFGGELQRRSGPERAIVALGDVPAEDLARYYAGARAVVQPALREGFGLPMLEAMAAGAPVVASEQAVPTALRPAALTYPTHDANALRMQLEKVLDDEEVRERATRLGNAVAQQLSWDRCAEATADVYREVLEQS